MKLSKNQILPILLIITIAAAPTLLFTPTANAQTTLNVPSTSYPTIQSALNAAKDGDTIKIASGTYQENINYDGYALAVAAGSSQPKTGITLQGSQGTTINGAVSLLYLKQFKISGLTISGDLTLGNCGAYGYVSGSIVSGVQVGSILTVGGSGNTVVDSQVKMLILKGGNTKMEFPVCNTNVENNQLRGLTIQAGSYGNTIKGNVISHGITGLMEEPSKTYYTTGNNQIINNTITNNDVGISLYSSTGDNGAPSHSADQIVQNIIRDNAVGISLSASNQYVLGNTFYHNDFISNGIQVKINNPVTNVWDDGAKKGNYWSTYTGSDGNSDGIGDTPYQIDAQNIDNYPLMKPWSAPATPPTPTPTSNANTSPNPSPSPSPTPSQSLGQSNQQSDQAAPSASPSPSQTPLSVAPESTPLIAVIGLVAVSLVALIFLKRTTGSFL